MRPESGAVATINDRVRHLRHGVHSTDQRRPHRHGRLRRGLRRVPAARAGSAGGGDVRPRPAGARGCHRAGRSAPPPWPAHGPAGDRHVPLCALAGVGRRDRRGPRLREAEPHGRDAYAAVLRLHVALGRGSGPRRRVVELGPLRQNVAAYLPEPPREKGSRSPGSLSHPPSTLQGGFLLFRVRPRPRASRRRARRRPGGPVPGSP